MASNSTISGSSVFIAELQGASRYMSISIGFFFFLSGILGNFLNILTFVSLGHFKHNPCSLYMLSKASLDISALIVGLGTRILAAGFPIDWALSDRPCLLAVQSIDNFLCSSSSAIVRQKSNIRCARRIVCGIFIFGFLHSLPFFFYQNLVVTATGASSCNTINAIYNQYQLYFINLCLYVAIPIAVISLFGLLTYRNIHSINVQQERRTLSTLVRQMIRMSLCNIVIVIVFVAPYGVIQLYALLTTGLAKSTIRVAQEQVVSTFSTVYFYGAFSSSFYCFFTSSKRFREQVWSALITLPAKIRGRENQVYPFSHTASRLPNIQQRTTIV